MALLSAGIKRCTIASRSTKMFYFTISKGDTVVHIQAHNMPVEI